MQKLPLTILLLEDSAAAAQIGVPLLLTLEALSGRSSNGISTGEHSSNWKSGGSAIETHSAFAESRERGVCFYGDAYLDFLSFNQDRKIQLKAFVSNYILRALRTARWRYIEHGRGSDGETTGLSIH
jgi:hypothetical protein